MQQISKYNFAVIYRPSSYKVSGVIFICDFDEFPGFMNNLLF